MFSLSQAKLYKEELCKFESSATHDYVKNILKNEISKLQRHIDALDVADTKNATISSNAIKILNYGWGQDDKYLELYVTLKGIHSIGKENIITNYGSKSVELFVKQLDGKNYSLIINNLCEQIIPDQCKIKQKTDLLIVMLKKKAENKNWPFVTENEKKLQESKDSKFKPSMESNDDPSKSLMDLMKKMYDEGDDDLKRTIQKSWHESQGKQAKGMF